MLPTGTVTFLFTDIEGSTSLVERLGPRSRVAFDRHDDLLRGAIEGQGGVVVRVEGDSFFAVFTSASDALAAAVGAQRLLQAEDWGEAPVWVRMGIHTGDGTLGGADYHGIDVHRAARVAAVANGGQIVVSATAHSLLAGHPMPGVTFRDLGLHSLKDLPEKEHLFDVGIDGVRSSFPPIRTVDAVPNNLPVQLTTFIGRRRHVDAVLALLGARRLITLTGPGGTGKTRMAIEVAAEATAGHNGVYFVPLASITEPELVVPTIVSTIGLRIEADYLERLIEYLAGKRWLLVLDNFEQVLDAGPDVARLVAECPEVTVLVTSRAALRVAGEQEYPVPPLDIPAGGSDPAELLSYEAVALFVDRAAAANPGFVLDSANAEAVCRLAARLDGLPLALELAAARTDILPPVAIVDRISRRLDVLSGGRRDAPERQRTIRATIAWSYDLLDVDAKRLFETLGVFVGGAEIEAIEAVGESPDVLDLLANLVQQSLVQRRTAGAGLRFSMLETIRQFAFDQLEEHDEAAAARRRHLRWYLDLATAAEPELTGPDGADWLGRLDADIDNIRAALAWAVESGAGDEAAEIVGALWRYWHMRGLLQEGRERAAAVLGMAGLSDASSLRAREAAGGLAYWQGDEPEARRHYGAAVDLARSIGDRSSIANALYNAAFPYLIGMDWGAMKGLLEESHALYRDLEDRAGIAKVMWGLGNMHKFTGELDAALADFGTALSEYEALGDRFMRGWTHRSLGGVLRRMGDLAGARRHVTEGLQIFSAAGDVSGMVFHLRDAAELFLEEGRFADALVLVSFVEAYLARFPVGLAVSGPNALPDVGMAVERVGDREAARLRARGAALTIDEAVALALSKV